MQSVRYFFICHEFKFISSVVLILKFIIKSLTIITNYYPRQNKNFEKHKLFFFINMYFKKI